MIPVILLAFFALVGVTLYAIFGGADFGGGIWDLFATGPRRELQRKTIATAMGPVWETNHVWLIFIIVMLFSGFPSFFATISVALYIPLTLILIGVILRGAAFAFRAHAAYAAHVSRAWGRVFGIASLITPFLYGATAGALAQGSFDWTSPFSLAIGAFALAVCAQLAAVFLILETEDALVRTDFERRGLIASLVVAVIGAGTLFIAHTSAPEVFRTLFFPRAIAGIAVAMISGLFAMLALVRRQFQSARICVVLQTLAILYGWFSAQAPYVIPRSVTIFDVAAPSATIIAILWTLAIGSTILLPSLWLLFAIFKGKNPSISEHE
jgi:cytochrome d ubiquinol oxidase subunit II